MNTGQWGGIWAEHRIMQYSEMPLRSHSPTLKRRPEDGVAESYQAVTSGSWQHCYNSPS